MKGSLFARGAVTGLVGAAVVALWFFVLDVLGGRPFFTPAALGSAFFLNAQGPEEVRVTAPIIAAYTAFHIAIFIGAGVLFTAAADYLERRPRRVLMVFLAAIIFESLVLAVFALYSEWVLGELGIWAITVANAVSVGAMAWIAWRSHPGLQEQLPRTAPDV
jgi:hypothetical protein